MGSQSVDSGERNYVKTTVSLSVNGIERSAEVEPRALLVQFLRDNLGLTGTHTGCETSQCGACTVLLDGEAVKSCTVLAVQADGHEVTTIEGLAPAGMLHPVQATAIAHWQFWARAIATYQRAWIFTIHGK